MTADYGMGYDTYGHTPLDKAFGQGDVYGVAYDAARAARPLVRIALIGAGGVAQSKYFPAVARLRMIWEPVEIVAFAEPREEHGRKVQAIYGGKWYRDYQDMLAEEAFQAVIVLSPDNLHAEHVRAALDAGRHVLVEKPITRSMADAQQICQMADDKHLCLMSVANKRLSPPYRRLKRFIESGPLHNPALYSAKFNLGYDYVDLFESGTIHLFDLTRYLMGDVRSVYASGVNRYGRNTRHYPVDSAALTLEFVSGAVGSITTSSTALSLKPWERVEVYGDHAWAAVEDQLELILYDGEAAATQSWRPAVPNTLLFDEEFGGYMWLIENFVQSIRGNEQPVVTGWDGYRALEILRATQMSLHQHQSVTLPLTPDSAEAEAQEWLRSSGWNG